MIVGATRDNPSESLQSIVAAPPTDVLPRLATANARLMPRAARPIESAQRPPMDAELRPLRDGAQVRLRAAFRAIADRLDESGLLRVDAQEAADAIYGIASDATFLRMTDGVGLTPEEYAEWLAGTLGAVLLR